MKPAQFTPVFYDFLHERPTSHGRTVVVCPSVPVVHTEITGEDLGLLAGGSQSVVVMPFYLRTGGGGGRHMCRSTYIRVNISRLLILQFLH